MGLTKNMLTLLMSVKAKRALNFDSILMIGRQNIFFSIQDLKQTFQFFGHECDDVDSLIVGKRPFADTLFKHLGAKIIESIDASGYEEATHVHDFNKPLNEDFKNTYSLVLDSGTLEHIFNVPQAIVNMTKLVELNGHYLGILPANNFFGHGFYQFSSEFFYRLFTEQNGFKMIEAILFMDEPNPKFYNVPDTSELYQRIQFTNTKPVYIFVMAKRINNNKMLSLYPQQRDYSDFKWKHERSETKLKRKKKLIKDYIPIYFKNLFKVILNRPLITEHFNLKKPYFEEYKLKP